MSILSEAHNFVIHGGEFRSLTTYNHYGGSSGIDILLEAATPEAAFDAEEQSYAASCFPGTRRQYIKDITDWATMSNISHTVDLYWMRGPAGVGKSAIAQTCAEKLDDDGKLGGAFFFSVNGRRKDHTRFFPTLAHQLSTIHSEYRKILDHKISLDRTLVKKKLSAQFKSLIVDPLLKLKNKGEVIGRLVILIDGLDECESQDAQVEIIKIIASSIRNNSTPFCWAIFSREEPHLVSAFAADNVSPYCHTVFLPISDHNVDGEIELYLRAGFTNILHRRNLLHLATLWPTHGDIEKLVYAVDGLFAHSATILHFVDSYLYSGFKESLEAILAPSTSLKTDRLSPYMELDNLYTLILQRIPHDIQSLTFLLLAHLSRTSSNHWHIQTWHTTIICNALGLSETVFQSICNQLQAVITAQVPLQHAFNASINPGTTFYDQFHKYKFGFDPVPHAHLCALGTINFYHKSFMDFLVDPSRSSVFCVNTSIMHQKLFDHLVSQHLRYSSSYSIHDSKLVLQPNGASSSASLSWSGGTEFIDSLIGVHTFCHVSFPLCQNDPRFSQYLKDVPSTSLCKLAELDYRKFLLAEIMMHGIGKWRGPYAVIDMSNGIFKITETSEFIRAENYDEFNPDAFLEKIEKLEKTGAIRPHHPHSVLKPNHVEIFGKYSGLYHLGRDEKSVAWYWEFNTIGRYYHEIWALNAKEAMAFYNKRKFTIWDEDMDSDIEESLGSEENEGGTIDKVEDNSEDEGDEDYETAEEGSEVDDTKKD